jgi:hypothetical protein
VLEDATVVTFAPHVGEPFSVAFDDRAVTLELVEASPASDRLAENARRAGLREPFSLQFRGPGDPFLRQRIYRLEHDALGALDIFLVPIGADGDGFRYEAVFG